MCFIFVIKARHNSLSCDSSKITQKEMLKLFLCDYLTTHYSMVNCHRNINFEEIDTKPSNTGGFWLLWGTFKEYIKENINIAVLRKANIY